jgi:DNA-binding CsgD family transcriptional regulator
MLAVHLRLWALTHNVSRAISGQNAGRHQLAGLAIKAARLSGGASALRAKLGVDIMGLTPLAEENDSATNVIRQFLGAAEFAMAERQGKLLRPELGEVQRMALGTRAFDGISLPLAETVAPRGALPWGALTTAEKHVALLAAAGWTNTAIAMRRGSSFKTVNAQMTAIFQKLIITSREDIINFVPEDQIDHVRFDATSQPGRNGRQSARQHRQLSQLSAGIRAHRH